jgi:ElaB/YqjD/DUF883 family membrane-anchored ribosome-binding protein
MAEEAMTEEKAAGAEWKSQREERADAAGGEGNGAAAAFEHAGAALSGLRSAVDHASRSLRELSRAGEEWAKGAETRAIEIGKDMRGRGERAVGGVARQVEQNPLASLAVAFALGFVCATLATLARR